MKFRYITIEREYGSGGTKIARTLSEVSGVPCYGEEILEAVNDKIEKEYHTTQCTVYYDKDGESVIVVGYTLPSSEKGELN